MKRTAAKGTIVLLSVLSAVVYAQSPPENNLGIGQKMKQNAEALKQYSYKRRTEIKVKDKSRTRLDQVRYVDGKMETIPLETPARANQSGRATGLRGKIVQRKIEKKKEEMKAETERLTSLLHSYVAPGSDSIRMMLQKAVISRLGSTPDADVKVVATGLKQPSDSFTLIWSPAHQRPVGMDIQAAVDGKPVRLTIDYAALPGGPFYAAHIVIAAPKKGVTITIDSFDYTLWEGRNDLRIAH